MNEKPNLERATYRQLFALLTIAWLLITVVGFILAWAVNAQALPRPIPAAFILRGLDVLPVYHLDRGLEYEQLKAEQSARIAAAIQEAAGPDRELAALLLTVGFHESGWSLAIEKTVCGPKQCDRDRKGNVRAVSSFQLHVSATSSREAWEAAKTDVRVAAKEAAFALKRARNMCRSVEGVDPVRGTLRGYAGIGCRRALKDEDARLKTFGRIRGQL